MKKICLQNRCTELLAERICCRSSSLLKQLNLLFDKLFDVATDGAPAMVGTHKGLISLLKKKTNANRIRHDKLVFWYCIFHQQSLCAKFVKFDHVVLVVTDCINFITKGDLNYRIFKQVLKDFDVDHDDLFISVLFVERIVGICLGAFIFFCQKLSSVQI